MEEEIDLKELFNMFWSRKYIIILIVVLVAGAGFIYSKFMITPDYKSSTTLVLTKNVSSDETTITQSEVTLNQKLVATYTELVRSSNVLRQVISNLDSNINENVLKNRVSVNLVTGTQMIEITVTNENPETAQIFANEITKVFIEKVKDIYKIDNIILVDEAKIENTPYNINHTKNLFIFATIGMVTALSYVFVANMLDTTIKTSEEAEKRLGLNVLASIPNYDLKKKGKK